MLRGALVGIETRPHSVRHKVGRCLLLAGFGLASTSALAAVSTAPVTEHDGSVLFAQHCAQCHDGSVPRAPHQITFSMMTPESILAAMNDGVMSQQAAVLSPGERAAVTSFLSEAGGAEAQPVRMCETPDADLGSAMPAWHGWGGDLRNYRYQSTSDSGLDRDSVQTLRLKWVFAIPGATRARSQPLVVGNTVFTGSQDGTVYALDLDSGCAHWRYTADAEVRNGPTIGTVDDQPVLFFGDFSATAHAVDARTGAGLWRTELATHPDATITGSLKFHDGRVFVPISSSEWASAADPGYACCTFRGGVAAVDAASGERVWNSHVIPEEAVDTGTKNPAGVARFAPAGAPVWNSPSIDAERALLYVGTGEAYTSPASSSSDAVIAFRLSDGARVWSRQLLAGDAWNMACFIGGGGNCPEENGPDLDIGAATILWQDGERDLLLVGQKSGDVYALDPARGGAIVWQDKLGRGGFAGGVHWGMTTNGTRLFVPIADTSFGGEMTEPPRPGLSALDPATGNRLWYTRADDVCAEELKPLCDPGLSAAISSTDELVFAGAFDGWLRAYDAASGEIVWQFNTADRFESVSGEMARGGSIESDGPVLVRGHVLVNSGYQFGGRMPGNALMVFAVDDETSVQESGGE